MSKRASETSHWLGQGVHWLAILTGTKKKRRCEPIADFVSKNPNLQMGIFGRFGDQKIFSTSSWVKKTTK